jgi:DNA adenine methylase
MVTTTRKPRSIASKAKPAPSARRKTAAKSPPKPTIKVVATTPSTNPVAAASSVSGNTPIVIERKLGKPDTSGRYLYYPGAKETILDVILRLIPINAIRLIEPFTGSGALASGLAFRFKQIEASDLNAELIAAHNKVIGDTDNFIAALDQYFSDPGNTTKEYYDAVKSKFNAPGDEDAKTAMLVFMNRKGFKGLMRRNKKKGEFNVPFWKKRADEPLPKAQLTEFAERLGGKTRFSTQDFAKALKQAGRNDFCYLDPPYLAEEGKEEPFAEYVGAFTEDDHKRMAALCKSAADRGATVVVSNHDSNKVRKIYGSASRFYVLTVPRGMSDATGKGDSTAKEILAVWKPRDFVNMVESFVRKPPLGQNPDPFGIHADFGSLEQRVFRIAKANKWLKAGATADKITFRTFRESGRSLLTIAIYGSPALRRLALEKPGRERYLSLNLLESLITTDHHFAPSHLYHEEESAKILLDLARRLEKALDGNSLADKALARILRYKAETYITIRPEDQQLPTKRLPERYRAVIDVARKRRWGFDSEPVQRLLIYAELCQDSGTNDFLRFCADLFYGVPLKVFLDHFPPIKKTAARGVGKAGHAIVPAKFFKQTYKKIVTLLAPTWHAR